MLAGEIASDRAWLRAPNHIVGCDQTIPLYIQFLRISRRATTTTS